MLRNIAAKFRRRLRPEFKGCTPGWMNKTKMEGMQAKPAKWVLCAAVGSITDDRMSHLRQVNSNLIFAPRLQGHFKNGEITQAAQNAIVGYCTLSPLCILSRVHPERFVLRQMALDRSLVFAHDTLYNRPIFSLDIVCAEYILQQGFHMLGFCKNQNPACEFIEAVHDEKLLAGFAFSQMFPQKRKSRAFPFVESCHRQQTRRLRDEENVAILVQDLHPCGKLCPRRASANLYDITGLDLIGPDGAHFTVYAYPALRKHLAQSSFCSTGDQELKNIQERTGD
jgi:hypothetical protein